jgi:hypothetical protein
VDTLRKLFMDRYGRFWDLELIENRPRRFNANITTDEQWSSQLEQMGFRSYLVIGHNDANIIKDECAVFRSTDSGD